MFIERTLSELKNAVFYISYMWDLCKKGGGYPEFREVWWLALEKTEDEKTLKISNCLALKTEDLATKPENGSDFLNP